jgi:hypothetical protein
MPQLGQHCGEMVATAAGATVPNLNIVGIIGTKVDLSVQIAAIRM